MTTASIPLGLCAACRHHRVVGNRRGSLFHLCERSRVDRRFARYPPIPVFRCPGFEPEPAAAEREGREDPASG